ncbi:hypothetical protein [Acetobacter orleanensis]|uniref:Uncharacterized protein n=1 Tax=Acetobacter orleanensis TaxID=104099 RepID=A0A4Y3THP8_9PROT|nr:hypothetical protein [Acetobacter orleanensis]GAN67481.1 hypothetical protein Abol_003_107 [Acetobacter orleanensis JCM 7639]GBR26487.1 hypothetical protein AA0473_1155 [Acetobacter orleanensis NRIC 0473]GEB81806.1 hypothetical protein AOR01nite_02830 [Acetobacter orleanensis]
MVNLRERMLTEAFWRWAWGASLALALLVLAGICYNWDEIVRVWPAAARLHLPG